MSISCLRWARLAAEARRNSSLLTRRWREQDSKRRSLSQDTSVFRGKMRPKEADRSGLGPPHHLSGTEGSNPARSSGESANHHHDRLMGEVPARISDRRVLGLILATQLHLPRR